MKINKFEWKIFYILNFVADTISLVTRYHCVPCFDIKYLKRVSKEEEK